MSPVPVTVPSVGESISEGILSRWHKADGSLVRSGEPLFELETDKATSDVPAAGSGVLRIAVKEGETVAVGATVATIDPADSTTSAPPAAKEEPVPPAPNVNAGQKRVAAAAAAQPRRKPVRPQPNRFRPPSEGSSAKSTSTFHKSPPPVPVAGLPRETC